MKDCADNGRLRANLDVFPAKYKKRAEFGYLLCASSNVYKRVRHLFLELN
jgi:hypothetical protein